MIKPHGRSVDLDLPSLHAAEVDFAEQCGPDVAVLSAGYIRPEPGRPLPRWIVLWWDGQRVHYKATRNPIRHLWNLRRFTKRHNALPEAGHDDCPEGDQ